MMETVVAVLLDQMDSVETASADVMSWGAPVPAFGDPRKSNVATLGLNPSSREFVDVSDRELIGRERRFPTLGSLGLESWLDAHPAHFEEIASACRRYFSANPYDRWFGRLEDVVRHLGATFYGAAANACHLDLVPFATATKWADLSTNQKSSLLNISGAVLASVLEASEIEVLILNGRSVVDTLETELGVVFEEVRVSQWDLPRRNSRDVAGIGFVGNISELSGIQLDRDILVVGFNHNLQSSYGVSNRTVQSIGLWIREVVSSHGAT